MITKLMSIWNQITRRSFFLGLLCLSIYAWSIHPPEFSLGYVGDLCSDIARQVLSENLQLYGKPVFRTQSFMAPTGISMPYMSWSIERDWLGAYVWKWFPTWPWQWLYFNLSLFLSYLGLGFILNKMNFSRHVSWFLSMSVVLFNIPRHFKIWFHFEHLPQHWIYFSFFMDAWIWQNLWRYRRWKIHLEFWRFLVLMGGFLSAGYFWGPLLFEWLLVRISEGGLGVIRKCRGVQTQVEWQPSTWIVPIFFGLILLTIELRWFQGLLEEVKVVGPVYNNLGWFSEFYLPFRPLWWDRIVSPEPPFFHLSETVSSVGWFLLIPFFYGLQSLWRVSKRSMMVGAFPFLVFILLAYLWQSAILPDGIINFIRGFLPFMDFFRVASRWSLFMPAALGAVLVLTWPELISRLRIQWERRRWVRMGVVVFLVSSGIELSWLFYPVKALPPLPTHVADMLTRLRKSSGTTVLDMPFCVAGGNGYCTAEECPQYPDSTVGQCFRLWHSKKVYGLYQARMNRENCEIYHKEPYLGWFQAWGQKRCFTPSEWKSFCFYLDEHKELSAILLYPDLWPGRDHPECLAEFERKLGPHRDSGTFPLTPTHGGTPVDETRLFIFGTQCNLKEGAPAPSFGSLLK